tara:strand:- start:64 stop:414 length:351 start_codon:yes stop_codon:yes gene_type:complete
MPTDVVVCNGCCCGNTDKGHPEVPIKLLNDEWEKYRLNDSVKLRISKCLGPCSMHNVSLLRTDNSTTWIGNLSEEIHYKALVDWALQVSEKGSGIEIPEILIPHKFERFDEVVIRD